MAIAFEEIEAPRFSVDDGGLVGHRTFKCAWLDTLDFMEQLYGISVGVGGQVQVKPPVAWPGTTNLFVREVHADAFDPQSPIGQQPNMRVDDPVSDYQFAKLQVVYRPWPTDNTSDGKPSVPSGTFLEAEGDLSTLSQPVPNTQFKWGGGGGDLALKDGVEVPFFVPQQSIRLTWRRVPYPPWDTISKFIGGVNAQTFMRHVEGTVMFTGARWAYDFQFNRGVLYKLEYNFAVKEAHDSHTAGPFGHNYFYRPDADPAGTHWQTILAQPAGDTLFAVSDFDNLFQYGSS